MRIDRRWPFATLPDGYAPISAGGRACRDGAARDRVQACPTSPYMGIFSYLTGFGGRDMAVDLGTANTLGYGRGRGIGLAEARGGAMASRTRPGHAGGREAKPRPGRPPGQD